MAHECPTCGITCHCGGDIDDICFNDTPEQMGCTCCMWEDDDDEDEPGCWCSFCGYIYSEDEHEPHCPHFRS